MHDHAHTHDGHDHHHDLRGAQQGALITGIIILLVFVGLQITGGIIFSSLALLSDAVHMLSDIGAFALALVAIILAKRPSTRRHTYGLARAEFLASLINGTLLAVAAGWIIIEGIGRIFDPPTVNGLGVVAIASAGLVANIVVAWLLARNAHGSINMQAAMSHAMLDAASSGGVIVAGLTVWLTGWSVVDPIISIVIGIVAIRTGVLITMRAAQLLVDAVPSDVDIEAVASIISSDDAVTDLHDVHVWPIGSGTSALTAHLLVHPDAAIDEVIERLTGAVRAEAGINHVTLQVAPDRSRVLLNPEPTSRARNVRERATAHLRRARPDISDSDADTAIEQVLAEHDPDSLVSALRVSRAALRHLDDHS